MTQATGQGKIPIYAESETKFFPTAMPAEIEFFKDEPRESNLPGPASERARNEGAEEVAAGTVRLRTIFSNSGHATPVSSEGA